MIKIENLSTKEKEELSEKLKINKSTLYRYRTEKEYLYKLIELGLQKEKEIKNEINNKDDIQKTLNDMMNKINSMESKVNYLEDLKKEDK